MDSNASFVLFVLVPLLIVGLFILTRLFWLWYFKINEGIKLQKIMINEIRTAAGKHPMFDADGKLASTP